MTTDQLEQFSEALADRLAAATFVVAIRTGRRGASGILWRDDVVVTSEQVLPEGTDFTVVRGGTEARAQLAGRDPGTNIAVLRLAQKLDSDATDRRALPSPRLARPHRRRRPHRCANGSPRYGACDRTGMAQPGRRSHRHAAAARRAARRRRGRCQC